MNHPHHYFLYFIFFLLSVISTTGFLIGPVGDHSVLAQTASIYYVDNVIGSDTNSGTSSQPFKTIARASTLVNPGDIVRIKATSVSYEESITPKKSGTADGQIIYEGWGGNPRFVTLNKDPLNVSAARCINLNTVSFITVRNIICDGRGTGPITIPGVVANATDSYKYTGFNMFAQIYAGSYNTIENNQFIGALIGYPPYWQNGNGIQILGNSSVSPIIYAQYNKILNNKIITTGMNAWHLIGVSIYSSHNLIEGNELVQTAGEFGATHQAVQVLSNYNIVRNNRITNGSHTGVSFERNGTTSDADHNVFEDNRVFDTMPSSTGGTGAMQMANQKAIIRRNFFYRNPAYGLGIYRGGASTEEARFLNDNHIYQNTFYKNLQVSPPPVVSDAPIKFAVGCGVPLAGNTQDNVIKNNIIYRNGSIGDIQLNINLGCDDPTNSGVATVPIYGLNGMVIAGNSILSAPGGAGGSVYYIKEATGSTKNLSQVQSAYPTLAYQNIEMDPLFVSPDTGTPDFSLQQGSPVIDKGVFLTKAYPAGNALVRFDDPYYFTDGYGLVPGDQIKFKTSGAVRTIQILNYNSKTAIIDSPITLPAGGDDVALVYNGTAPDIGAVESSYSAPVVDTPPAITISATPSVLSVGGSTTFFANASDDKAVAGVQFRVNGVNQGAEDTTSPYQLTYLPLVAGTYTITAVARDSAGQTTVSSSATLTVSQSTATLQNLIFVVGSDAGSSLSGKSVTLSILPPGSTNQTTPLESQTITASGPSQVSLSTTSRTAGSYDVRIKGPTTLSRKQTFTLSSNSTFTFTQKLISGDLNNDNSINSLDWSLMNTDWFQTNRTSDLNGDGVTNALDFTWLNRNWFMRGE